MHKRRLEFRPGRWPTLITIVVFGVLSSLGFWQLDRAEQKRALLSGYHSGSNDTVLELGVNTGSLDGLQYQFAVAEGHYDAGHQFLLDNRTYKGVAGYQVLTPIIFSGARKGVLVNRGWIPIGGSREQLPELPLDGEARQVLGRIKLPSTKGFRLGNEEPREGWPYRIQRVDIDSLSRELGYPLLPMVLLLNDDQADGFVREWNPLTFGPERNVGYAVQWFGLAMALLVIYIFVNLKKAGEP